MSKIILASASPRRRQLLEQAGFCFDICASTEEEHISSADPEEAVRELSAQKAENVEKRFDEDVIIIGADTVVSCEGQILGKPADDDDALRMLKMLQGAVHQVFTGVTIIEKNISGRKETSFVSRTDVEMYPAAEGALRSYIASGEGRDKAGSYAIQGKAAVFVKSISGDYNTVVGLPVAAIWQYLYGEA